MSGKQRGRPKGRPRKSDKSKEKSQEAEEEKTIPSLSADNVSEEKEEDEIRPSKVSKEEEKEESPEVVTKKRKKKSERKKKADRNDDKRKRKTKAKRSGAVSSGEKEKVLQYLKDQNRPYSMQNIFDNLHGEIKKADMQKVLDSLVADKEITSKDFGKFVVYLINQESFPSLPQEELDSMDADIISIRERVKTAQEELKELQHNFKAVISSLSNTDLVSRIEEIERENAEVEAEITALRDHTVELVSEELMKEAEKEEKNFTTEWNKRKKRCMETISMISEGMEKSNTEVFELIGLEEDPPDS